MDFHTQFDIFIRSCKQYQKQIDAKDLHFSEPYQSIYLAINKVLKIHTEQKLNIEAIAAGEQKAPGFPNLTPARREYYELEAEVPSFLANGGTAYYYLQRYKIACTYLVKTFSYSTYKGDWEKMRHLGNWLGAIYNQQRQSNTKESLAGSIESIKELGNFGVLETKDLQFLEEEVQNIQALLIENPDLQDNLSLEETQLLQKAVDHLSTKEDVLKGLPPLDNSFKYDEPPAIEVVAYRCKQLMVLLDNFHKNYNDDTFITKISNFKQALRDSFDLHINICEKIYNSIIDIMASFQVFSLKKLCTMLYEALQPFTDEGFLYETYGTTISVNHIEVAKGIPDTIELETLLMLAIFEDTQ